MGSQWKKFKLAISMNVCVHLPKTLDGSSSSSLNSVTATTDDESPAGDGSGRRSSTTTPSSSALRLSKSGSKSKSSKQQGTCAICLNTMISGQGHAIFTAECSHTFHFHCITSNVKHGNRMCPICRAKWKEVPFPSPASNGSSNSNNDTPRINRVNFSPNDLRMRILRNLPSPQPGIIDHRHMIPPWPHHVNVTEPATFDDDESLDVLQPPVSHHNANEAADHNIRRNSMEMTTYPEVSAVLKSSSHDNFAVLIHIKAPAPSVQNSRAPVDLVTVLDVSGSMAGNKLALLKQAMGFVIQNMSSSDRLSVIAFSSTSRRVFPLQRMTESGRQQALQAVNALVTCGGTNIAEGLKKGIKVFVDRKWKNPVASIILLSDGQDTHNVICLPEREAADYRSLVPNSIHRDNDAGLQIPVHAFGVGADHDAALMHSISEISGGTFSFIENEDVIQDAFAQCIGGLLSVVVQELQVEVECVHPRLQLSSVKAGSYQTSLIDNARMACIKVGHLYAEEERDFLVMVNVPAADDGTSSDEMSLMAVRGLYRDPLTKEMVGPEETREVKIQRPNKITRGGLVVSMEVDKQRNRLRAAEAMAEARAKAEHGDLSGAVSVLEECHKVLCETVSGRAGDPLCVSLCAELKEMQERMANRRVYEESGRAYVLSGLSSHSWQRATTRSSDDSASFSQLYQTPVMADMVTRSQTMIWGPPPQSELARSCPPHLPPRK